LFITISLRPVILKNTSSNKYEEYRRRREAEGWVDDLPVHDIRVRIDYDCFVDGTSEGRSDELLAYYAILGLSWDRNNTEENEELRELFHLDSSPDDSTPGGIDLAACEVAATQANNQTESEANETLRQPEIGRSKGRKETRLQRWFAGWPDGITTYHFLLLNQIAQHEECDQFEGCFERIGIALLEAETTQEVEDFKTQEQTAKFFAGSEEYNIAIS
jgi:hypothetical protein